jgi:hypothetical protein
MGGKGRKPALLLVLVAPHPIGLEDEVRKEVLGREQDEGDGHRNNGYGPGHKAVLPFAA